MITDVTLKQDFVILKIHKNFFSNKSFPVEVLKLNTDYQNLSDFALTETNFGFNGCFVLISKDDDYKTYSCALPKSSSWKVSREMLMTIHLMNYYVLEQMYYLKEFFSDKSWVDQSLSFNILNGGLDRCGYSIGGQIYPWLKQKLCSLSDASLEELNDYVDCVIGRVHKDVFDKQIFFTQINIQRHSFFIQISIDGRWISWDSDRGLERPNTFDSHNMDHSSDQFMCFIAIVAINSWLRIYQ